jgi:hypothetical protein
VRAPATEPPGRAGGVGYRGAVIDGSRLPLTGRVVLPLAVLLALLGSGDGGQPGMAGAPPARPTLRAARAPQSGDLGRARTGHA